MLEGDSRLLSDDPPHELPLEGKIRCVLLMCVCFYAASRRCFVSVNHRCACAAAKPRKAIAQG